MKVAITGASGMIGSALVPHLRSNGHEVVRLVRGVAGQPDEVSWDPEAGHVDLVGLADADAVVHLAGAGVGDRRWTAGYQAKILDSRVRGTDTIARAIAALDRKPSVLVSASAVGYYPGTGATTLDEDSPPGDGFLSDVCQAWEAAADPARAVGVRVAHPRTGLVLHSHGGAWGKLWPIFALGGGGRLGSGRQWWSWISMRDQLAALDFLLAADLDGPVNLTAPNPVTNAEVTAIMGRLMRRPTLLPVPAAALQAALGGFSDEILSSRRVLPTRLLNAGFNFQDPTIETAIEAALTGRR